jgi:hypothetical protein
MSLRLFKRAIDFEGLCFFTIYLILGEDASAFGRACFSAPGLPGRPPAASVEARADACEWSFSTRARETLFMAMNIMKCDLLLD